MELCFDNVVKGEAGPMAVEVDPLLVSGDDDAIHEFAADTDRCIVVDWREDDGELIGSVADQLPGLSFDEDESGEDLILSYKDKTLPVGLTGSPRDRYITIRALNRVLAGDHEMRLFRVTADSDTHSFYLRPADWWREAAAAHPEEIARVFQVVDEGMDFP